MVDSSVGVARWLTILCNMLPTTFFFMDTTFKKIKGSTKPTSPTQCAVGVSFMLVFPSLTGNHSERAILGKQGHQDETGVCKA